MSHIADGIAVGLRDGDQAARLVVLIEGIALRRRDSGEKPQPVIGVRLGLLARVVRREHVASLVVAVAGDMARPVRDGLQPALLEN